MYYHARGFLAQEISDSPDVVEMIVGVLTGFCDLHIHFQVRVKKSHPGFAPTSQVWSDHHPCLRVPAAVYFLQSRVLSCCHSPSACWKSSSSSVPPHNFQWQRLKLFDSRKEWVWMTGKLDGHRHIPGLLSDIWTSETEVMNRWPGNLRYLQFQTFINLNSWIFMSDTGLTLRPHHPST